MGADMLRLAVNYFASFHNMYIGIEGSSSYSMKSILVVLGNAKSDSTPQVMLGRETTSRQTLRPSTLQSTVEGYITSKNHGSSGKTWLKMLAAESRTDHKLLTKSGKSMGQFRGFICGGHLMRLK